jgi:hypothetical protein
LASDDCADAGTRSPPSSRNGKTLAEKTRVLIPAVITAVNGDICVVTLEDPMPPYQLTLETKLLVHDGEA